MDDIRISIWLGLTKKKKIQMKKKRKEEKKQDLSWFYKILYNKTYLKQYNFLSLKLKSDHNMS